MLLDLARAHSSVAIYFRIGVKTALLFLARGLDPLTNRDGIFFGARARNVAVFDGGDFDMEIDPIEERAGDALAIPLDLGRPAAAFAFQIAEVSAGTWIHRCDEHEFRRESDASGSTGHRNFPILKRLTHNFEGRAFELGQLVEKENAVMRQAHFSRGRNGGTAKQ